MRKLKIAYVASAVLAFWLTDVSQSQAQYRNTAPLNRGIPSVRGFGGARAAVANRNVPNVRNRRARGTDTLFYGNTGHEFARTIPRVFGDPILPYFALYPPVYYSAPVPRAYGFSPFALPPGVPPAEGIIGPAEAEVTVNPYFTPKSKTEGDREQEKEKDATEQQAAAAPRFIINPYFVKQITPADSKRLAEKIAPEFSETAGIPVHNFE